jgi:hypothetical protein
MCEDRLSRYDGRMFGGCDLVSKLKADQIGPEMTVKSVDHRN